jgi:hypothetical protein
MGYTQEQAQMMFKALEEISKGAGRYDQDRLTHAQNTIEDMVEIAKETLSKIK